MSPVLKPVKQSRRDPDFVQLCPNVIYQFKDSVRIISYIETTNVKESLRIQVMEEQWVINGGSILQEFGPNFIYFFVYFLFKASTACEMLFRVLMSISR